MNQSLTHIKRHSLGREVVSKWFSLLLIEKDFFRSIRKLEMIQSPTHIKKYSFGR